MVVQLSIYLYLYTQYIYQNIDRYISKQLYTLNKGQFYDMWIISQ